MRMVSNARSVSDNEIGDDRERSVMMRGRKQQLPGWARPQVIESLPMDDARERVELFRRCPSERTREAAIQDDERVQALKIENIIISFLNGEQCVAIAIPGVLG
jgi:hypothetical protein